MSEIIVISPTELRSLISEAVAEALQAQQAKPLPADRLLTRKDVAGLLRVSLPTIDSLVKRGSLTAIRTGRQTRFSETVVRAFMAGRK
jgi:excisionase family DNA binding protein